MYSSDRSGLIAHVSYASLNISPSNNRVAWLDSFVKLSYSTYIF
jgi:hypothetical protein